MGVEGGEEGSDDDDDHERHTEREKRKKRPPKTMTHPLSLSLSTHTLSFSPFPLSNAPRVAWKRRMEGGSGTGGEKRAGVVSGFRLFLRSHSCFSLVARLEGGRGCGMVRACACLIASKGIGELTLSPSSTTSRYIIIPFSLSPLLSLPPPPLSNPIPRCCCCCCCCCCWFFVVGLSINSAQPIQPTLLPAISLLAFFIASSPAIFCWWGRMGQGKQKNEVLRGGGGGGGGGDDDGGDSNERRRRRRRQTTTTTVGGWAGGVGWGGVGWCETEIEKVMTVALIQKPFDFCRRVHLFPPVSSHPPSGPWPPSPLACAKNHPSPSSPALFDYRRGRE